MGATVLMKGNVQMQFRNIRLTLPVLVAFLCFGFGCGENKERVAGGRMTVYSGLPPVAYLASAVGGDRVDSKSVLPEGRSPHDYSPGPGEIRGVMSAKLFLSTGMNFENVVARPVDKSRVVDVSEGVERIPFDGDHHHDDCEDEDHAHNAKNHDHKHGEISAGEHQHGDSCAEGHAHGAYDPHVWLSTHNAAVMADNIAKAFTKADPEGAAVYAANLAALKKKLAESQAYAEKELAPYRGREFFVYHPAFGYFAKSVGLKQVAIELGGREATPAHLASVIKRAKEGNVKVIFVQPQFNPTSARALGKAIGGNVAGLNSLAGDVPTNIHAMTDALKEGFSAGGKE